MLTTFYIAFSPACFSLLGLWLVIVNINVDAWLQDPEHERQAYAVALYFAAPGAMSLLALVNSKSTFAWRVFFIIVSVLGGAGLILYGRLHHRHGRHDLLEMSDHLVHWLAVGLYLVIAALAVTPRPTLRIEGVLLTILVLLGVHVAMRLMFAVGKTKARAVPGAGSPSAG